MGPGERRGFFDGSRVVESLQRDQVAVRPWAIAAVGPDPLKWVH
jgi:hypothetical protein